MPITLIIDILVSMIFLTSIFYPNSRLYIIPTTFVILLVTGNWMLVLLYLTGYDYLLKTNYDNLASNRYSYQIKFLAEDRHHILIYVILRLMKRKYFKLSNLQLLFVVQSSLLLFKLCQINLEIYWSLKDSVSLQIIK